MMYGSFFLIKYIATFIAYYIGINLFFNATLTEVLSFSLLSTILSFFLVDRLVLPRYGKFDAAVADFILIYLSIWIFGNVFLHSYLQIAWGSVISAVLFTISEVFVHRYIVVDLFTDSRYKRTKTAFNNKIAYGSEFGDDEKFRDDEE